MFLAMLYFHMSFYLRFAVDYHHERSMFKLSVQVPQDLWSSMKWFSVLIKSKEQTFLGLLSPKGGITLPPWISSCKVQLMLLSTYSRRCLKTKSFSCLLLEFYITKMYLKNVWDVVEEKCVQWVSAIFDRFF